MPVIKVAIQPRGAWTRILHDLLVSMKMKSLPGKTHRKARMIDIEESGIAEMPSRRSGGRTVRPKLDTAWFRL